MNAHYCRHIRLLFGREDVLYGAAPISDHETPVGSMNIFSFKCPHCEKRIEGKLNNKVVLLIIAVVVGGLGYGVYYLVTDAERTESAATNSLKWKCEHGLSITPFPDGQYPWATSLSGGGYAKHKFVIHSANWEIESNKGSKAFPFKGAIDVVYKRYATVSQPTREMAKEDEQWYANPTKNNYYVNAEDARNAAKQAVMKMERLTYLYDKSKGDWMLQSRKFR